MARKKIIDMSNAFDGNAAKALTVPEAEAAKKNRSKYTSAGKHKATASDPIRSKEEFERLRDAILFNRMSDYRYRDWAIVALGCTLGIRCGDLLSLKYCDVFKRDAAIRPAVEIYEEKTGKRSVNKITSIAYNALRMYRDNLALTNDVIEGIDDYENRPLFCSKKRDANGKRRALTVSQVLRILQNGADKAGLTQSIGTHTMRKTYGYMARKNAGPEKEAEIMLLLQAKYKHSDQRVTLRYLGIEQEEIDAMADLVNDSL